MKVIGNVSLKIEDFELQRDPTTSLIRGRALAQVLNSAITPPTRVPFSVYGKNLIQKGGTEEVSIDEQSLSKGEAVGLAALYFFGRSYYGEPIFDGKVDEKRFEDVDYGRNFIKAGRENGPEVRRKRLETLKLYLGKREGNVMNIKQHYWKNFLKWYCDEIATGKIKSTDKHTLGVTYALEKKNTNVGIPLMARKKSKVDGQEALSWIRKHYKDWNLSEYPNISAFLGARSQRGKQEYDAGDVEQGYKSLKVSKTLPEDFFDKVLIDEGVGTKEFRQLVDQIQRHITCPNYKARVITAGPSLFTYLFSPLEAGIVDHFKAKPNSNQVHLLGAAGIVDALRKMKKFCEAHNLLPFNADATKYDTTLTANHAQIFYDAYVHCFDKRDLPLLECALTSLFTRPLFYTPEHLDLNSPERSLKYKLEKLRASRHHSLGSGEPLTNAAGSQIMCILSHYARFVTCRDWTKITAEAFEQGFSPVLTNGDDNITLYKKGEDGSIWDDVKRHVDVMQSECGLTFQDFDDKGEAGYFYNQYRLTYDNRVVCPIPRIRVVWRESESDSLPPYHQALALGQNLEYRGQAKGIVKYVRMVSSIDKFKLGTVDSRGRRISLPEFMNFLKQECEDENKSSKEMLFKGDPKDEVEFTEQGEVNKEGIEQQGNLIQKALYKGKLD